MTDVITLRNTAGNVTPDITLASGRTFTHRRIAEDAQDVMDQHRNSEMSDAEWTEYCQLLAKVNIAQKAERHAASKAAYAAAKAAVPYGWTSTDLPALPAPGETAKASLAAAADACEQEARTIEEIAYCLRVWNVATWAGWTIIRIPGVTARSVRIEATEACGTVHLKDYPARTGATMPFDNHDVRRLLLPLGAVLAR